MALCDLVNDNRPVFLFHEDEKYFPTTPDKYLQNSNLYDGDDQLVQSAPISQQDLYLYRNTGEREYKLKLNDSSIINDEFDENVPVYAYVKEIDDKIYVTYVIFYSYSGPVNILGMNVGQHEADIEHVTMEFDSQHTLLRVYYGAHGYEEGAWIDASEISRRIGRPVVYVAKYTHANYFDKGIIFRYLGFGNDETSNSGQAWYPDVVYIRDEDDPEFDVDQSWIYYPGTWTGDGISGVVSQQWYKEIETVSAEHDYVKEKDLQAKQLHALINAVLDGSIFVLLSQLGL